jgi:hypothetical protein
VPNFKADLDLFTKIRLDKDGATSMNLQAGNAISKLHLLRGHRLPACRRRRYRVTLRTPFGETIHQVKIPTQRDITA